MTEIEHLNVCWILLYLREKEMQESKKLLNPTKKKGRK